MTIRYEVIHVAFVIDLNEEGGKRVKFEMACVEQDRQLDHKETRAAVDRLLANLEFDLNDCTCEPADVCPQHQLSACLATPSATH